MALELTQENINNMAADHALWLADNTKGRKAYFVGKNLVGLDLSGKSWANVDFTGANCYRTNFSGCNLSHCVFTGANLCRAIWGNATGIDTVVMTAANTFELQHNTYSFVQLGCAGTTNRHALYIPELNKVWAGCLTVAINDLTADIVTSPDVDSAHHDTYAKVKDYLADFAGVCRRG